VPAKAGRPQDISAIYATKPVTPPARRSYQAITAMKVLGIFLLWCLLLAVCWPLALLACILAPFVWLLALPFRLLGVCVSATFAFIRALFYLPARLLGGPRA
jgi:hypothetical protein